jgi:hypothetical protein
MREVISIHVGQAGCQIGNAAWEVRKKHTHKNTPYFCTLAKQPLNLLVSILIWCSFIVLNMESMYVPPLQNHLIRVFLA